MLTPDSKSLFDLEADTTFLNHGGYGVTPSKVRETRAGKLKELEANPTRFLTHDFSQAWHAIAMSIAERFSVRKEDISLVENVTDGVNAVSRSFPLTAGDEILTTSLVCGSVRQAAIYIASWHGAQIAVAPLRFSNPDPQKCIHAVEKAITRRTKLAILDHITSRTALVLPVAEMARAWRDRGVAVLVDGAHVPGEVAFDLKAIGADWYVADLRKWYSVPRGCGFLWAAPQRQAGLVPAILSSHASRRFPGSFEWAGTRDPTPWLSIPESFDFMDCLGEDAVRAHNHSLIRDAMALLANAWKVNIGTRIR